MKKVQDRLVWQSIEIPLKGKYHNEPPTCNSTFFILSTTRVRQSHPEVSTVLPGKVCLTGPC